MFLKGVLDRRLDHLLGPRPSANLPSRLIGCDQCKKIWNVNRRTDTCRHHQILADETWGNWLKSLRS